MATYAFKCLKCQRTHEHKMSMKAVEFNMKLLCPSCELQTFQRQQIRSNIPVHYKGGGWPDKDGR